MQFTESKLVIFHIFQPAFGCCALQALVEIFNFFKIYAEKLKKCKKVFHNFFDMKTCFQEKNLYRKDTESSFYNVNNKMQGLVSYMNDKK